MGPALPVATFRVGGSYLVIVSGTGGQASKSYLMARDHCRISGRTVFIGRDGSIIDCRVRGKVRFPNDLSGGGCRGCGLYARNFQSQRRIASGAGAASQARATVHQNRRQRRKGHQHAVLQHTPDFAISKDGFCPATRICLIAPHGDLPPDSVDSKSSGGLRLPFTVAVHSRYFATGLGQLQGRGGGCGSNCFEPAKLLRENKNNISIRTTGTRSSFGAGPKMNGLTPCT